MRLNTVFGYQRPWYVSIHASVKDATGEIALAQVINHVSIHASVKDATRVAQWGVGETQFQSTHL